MANTFLTPTMIANEALMVLSNNLVMANLVHRDYSKEFVKVGDTVTVRKPASFVAKNFTGTIATQEATEGSVDVKIDRFRDVSVPITSAELSLDIKDFSTQVVTPAMQAIAQAVDSDLMAVGISKAANSVTGTDSPSTLADIANLAKRLDLDGVPRVNRRLALNPTHIYRYLTLANLSDVSKSGDANALRQAELGNIYNFATYMSQNAPDTLAATAGTATAYKITAVKGESKVALTSMSGATHTVKTGDGFIIDGYLYRFAADGTGSNSAIAEIAIDQPIHAAFTTIDAYPVNDTNSLAFHRNGLALVTRQLELPMGASKAAIASADGLAVRVVFDYNISTKVDTVSFDIIYGVKELETKMLVKLLS
jgi:hypothetical protein